jgi:hypothetical protein
MRWISLTFIQLAFPLAMFAPLQAGAGDVRQAMPALGVRPAYGELKCKDIVIGSSIASKELAYVGVVEAAVREGGDSAKALFNTMPEEFLWWIRLTGSIDIHTVGMAVHETSHTLNTRLSNCNHGRASFYFEGVRWNTEYRSAGSPPYATAASYVPDALKKSPLSRYQNYFVRLGPNPANDFRALLDEFNAHVEGARVEVNAIGSPLYTRFVQFDAFDGNLGGTAEFMLYTLAYLKKLRMEHPEAWQAVRDSPLLLAHIQRMWSGAETLFDRWRATGDKKYVVSRDILHTVYQSAYIAELDRLDIRHRPCSPLEQSLARAEGVSGRPPVR